MSGSGILKIRIDAGIIKWYCLCIIIVIRFLLPSYIVGIIPETILSLLIWSSIGLMIGIIIRTGVKINFPLSLVVISCMTGIISTVVNHGNVNAAILTMTYTITECFFILSLLKNENRLMGFLLAVRDITLIFAVANLIIGIVMPHGIASISVGAAHPHFLYGNMNATVRSIMPGLCCSLLLDSKNQRLISMQTILIIFSFFYFVFVQYFMATGFTGIFFLVLWVILYKRISPKYKKAYLIVALIVFLIEVLVVFTFGQSRYALYITGLFSTKTGFSGREALWVRALNQIPQKLLWGYGRLSTEDMFFNIGNAYGSHNYYIDVLFQRGLIGFIPLLVLMLIPILWKERQIDRGTYILLGCCCSYYIMFLMEPFIGTEMLHIPILFMAMYRLMNNKIDGSVG